MYAVIMILGITVNLILGVTVILILKVDTVVNCIPGTE
jgi:hypothetical protein